MDFLRRQSAVEAQLEKLHLDAFLTTHPANVRYLCGFTGSSGALVLHDGRPAFFTDGRYTAQAREQVAHARVFISKGSPLLAAAQFARKKGLRTLGVERDHVTLGMHAALRTALGAATRLRGVSGVVERLRMIKDPEEVALIRDAVNLGVSLLDIALKSIRPGIAEAEVAAQIEFAARRAGAEAMSFETIVAAGSRSGMPHGIASALPIPARGFVVLDFGVILHGYCSDMTRTVHVGKASAGARRMYDSVLEAQQSAVNAVRAGTLCGQVDQAARSTLRSAGLARHFTHSTGHGVGLEIHEPPRIGRGQREPLQAGMMITIEPGVYVAGKGGVRIEDMVLVTGGGCEVLTPAPKDFIEL
ncbi:MAG: M24 family metallopeptidase [Terriglobales bacterium]